ncbi:MAG: UDP-N-acetylmuramate--L-alanine ligase, partial [Clostridiales bacterium]|nr:UDP-N-acetylmuramate--L-alanine ligase [Clostridiales bacterium]
MEYHDELSDVKKIHFVGIGGSGMCPLAEILHSRGFELTGSDTNESDTLARVRSYGIPVFMGHRAENIGDADMVVYTAAVKDDNPELVAARAKGIPTVERSVMLGIVTRRYPHPVAVSGTHGKTTTTAMITQILLDAGKDPSAVIGGKLPLIGGNGRVGNSGTIVCEACEYVDKFLQLHPEVSVILNVDADHLDYFGTVENIIKSFRRFAKQTSKTLIVNGDDENSMKAVEGLGHASVVTFGLDAKNDFHAENIADTKEARESFSVVKNGKKVADVQ